MPTDALSDVLKAVRLTGAAFFDVIACAPWVAEQPTREMVLPKVLPGLVVPPGLLLPENSASEPRSTSTRSNSLRSGEPW